MESLALLFDRVAENKFIGFSLGLRKDHRTSMPSCIHLHNISQSVGTFPRAHSECEVGDTLRGLAAIITNEIHVRMSRLHVLLRNTHNPLGHRCREEQHLRVGLGAHRLLANVLQNLLDVLSETDVKHAVGLVQDHVRDLGEIQRPGIHVVHNSPGSTHDDVCAVAKAGGLRAKGCPSIHGGRLDLATNALEIGCNLFRKLTGRGQHQNTRGTPTARLSLLDGGSEGLKHG
mmetsp:Transcript_37067/g.71863  ORF Transcript_37067/g.71863 Transcript_37067/m.71863 type:complete len:231 (+) Transcript_37067:851-1543(+)